MSIKTYIVNLKETIFDATKTILGRDQVTYTSVGTIAFVAGGGIGGANDAITDSEDGLVTAGFKTGDVIEITGSANNNDILFTIVSVAAGSLSIVSRGEMTDETGGVGAVTIVTPLASTIYGTNIVDHGQLSGLTDDDHTQYIKHALATAANDFLVASGSGTFVKKTLAEVLAILGISSVSATIPIAPVAPATIAGSATFVNGILTAYTAPS